jgi:hypothetical protein
MEDLGIEQLHGRPIRFLQLSQWRWENPGVAPFALLVAASATDEEAATIQIRRFADDAIQSGCGYICAWGQGCELVHDLFDQAALDVERFVMSTWHKDEPLSDALYFCLVNAFPDEDEFPNSDDSAVVLAVEQPWVAEVRGLVADQDELAKLWVAEDE